MRIIAGEWGGRPLVAPKGDATRPTSDRVREALFSALGDLEGATVLDLFAGTGAVALEALSRGAARAICVERARPAVEAIRENARRLGAGERLEIAPRDALRWMESWRGPPFDLVFADPPWDDAAAFALALGPRAAALVAPLGALVLERSARDGPAPPMPGLDGPRVRRYGDAVLASYSPARVEPPESV